MRVRCLYARSGCTRVRRRPGERHLPECIRPRHTGPTSGFMVWGAISYNSRSHMVFLQGKVNCARYIAHVNPVLLPFLQQEGDVHFQQDNECPHTAAATQRALRGVQELSWPARAQISRQLNTHGTWWSGNLLFLQSLSQPLPNCDNRCKMLGTIYCRVTRVTTRPDSCGTVPIIYLNSHVPKVFLNVPHNPTLFEIYNFYKFVLHEKEILQGAKSNKKSFKFTN